jgi:hypothetical protein
MRSSAKAQKEDESGFETMGALLFGVLLGAELTMEGQSVVFLRDLAGTQT